MTRIAAIGTGPGAMYTLKYLLKHNLSGLSRVDIFEKLSANYGLVRYGVAPDHVEVKEVSKEFSSLLRDHIGTLHLHMHHMIPDQQSFQTLRESYDAVLVATGAQSASRLPLKSLPQNTFAAQDFVLWYNGHPEKQDLVLPTAPRNVSIVGHGNVALDVARMLSKSVEELEPLAQSGLLSQAALDWLANRQSLDGIKSVSVLGRRGYLDAAFTNKEFRELTTMKDATCKINESELEYPIDELKQKSALNRSKSRGIPIVSKCIQAWNDDSKSNSIFLRFFCKPVSYLGDPVTGLQVSRQDGSVETLPTDLGIESIGFKVTNEFGLNMDERTGGIKNDGLGRVEGFPGVYVAGWAKRGPKGVIAANIPCCVQTAEAMYQDLSNPDRLHRPTRDVPNFTS